MNIQIAKHDFLRPQDTLLLLEQLPSLGPITCVVLHACCVFEFSGTFPNGERSETHLNLENNGLGFHGHLSLSAMERVRFQSRPHRGRPSYAFVFENAGGDCLFKVFLGRDAQGDVLAEQLAFFERLRLLGTVPPSVEYQR